jgi:hypothetical protein
MFNEPVEECDQTTLAKLRADAAELVMGWARGVRNWAYSGQTELWYDANGNGLMPLAAWRPDEDEAQCAKVLDAMQALGYEWQVNFGGEHIEARFHLSGMPSTRQTHRHRRMAIVQAAVRARQGSDHRPAAPPR